MPDWFFSFFVSFRVFFAISSNFLYQTANWILPSVTIPFQEEFLFQTETFIASKKKSGLVDSFSSDRETGSIKLTMISKDVLRFYVLRASRIWEYESKIRGEVS